MRLSLVPLGPPAGEETVDEPGAFTWADRADTTDLGEDDRSDELGQHECAVVITPFGACLRGVEYSVEGLAVPVDQALPCPLRFPDYPNRRAARSAIPSRPRWR